MIWLILGNESHQIISCNIFNGKDRNELWITRPNGKSMKVMDGDIDVITEAKEAIDFAVEKGFTTVVI